MLETLLLKNFWWQTSLQSSPCPLWSFPIQRSNHFLAILTYLSEPAATTLLDEPLPWPGPQIIDDASWASGLSSPGPSPSTSLPHSPQDTFGSLRHLHWMAQGAGMECNPQWTKSSMMVTTWAPLHPWLKHLGPTGLGGDPGTLTTYSTYPGPAEADGILNMRNHTKTSR